MFAKEIMNSPAIYQMVMSTEKVVDPEAPEVADSLQTKPMNLGLSGKHVELLNVA